MNYIVSDSKYDFSSDNINIIALLYDESGSMEQHVYAMQKANNAFYDDFSKFEEKGSIAISKATFNGNYWMSAFKEVKHFNTSYHADGATHLYSSIVRTVESTIAYYNELIKRLNVRARITFLVFTDGEDNEDYGRYMNNAKAAITELNSLDATTVFVAFGDAIATGAGEKLGFTCTKNITTVKELVACLGSELSKSCKEQSRSSYSLKSEFFSKASKDNAADTAADQAIVDDDFFNV
ncbi:MAG: VWA domain-containing protein [Clostridia bacterium]|nr:VWA domain-containing protein [Clostridia bacterium]